MILFSELWDTIVTARFIKGAFISRQRAWNVSLNEGTYAANTKYFSAFGRVVWVRTGTVSRLCVVTSLHHCVRRARVLWLKRNSAERAHGRGNAKSSTLFLLTPCNLFFSLPILFLFHLSSSASPSSPYLIFLGAVEHIQVSISSFKLCYQSYFFLSKYTRPQWVTKIQKTGLERGFTTPLGWPPTYLFWESLQRGRREERLRNQARVH